MAHTSLSADETSDWGAQCMTCKGDVMSCPDEIVALGALQYEGWGQHSIVYDTSA